MKVSLNSFIAFQAVKKNSTARRAFSPQADCVTFTQTKPKKQTPEALLGDLSEVLGDEKRYSKADLERVVGKINALSKADKKAFIKEYESKTGFPVALATSVKIESEVKSAILKTCEQTCAKVLFAGYNPTCSVGRRVALPGSDIDTLFICLLDKNSTAPFKAALKENIDPLLCSVTYNRTDDVPDYLSLDELLDSLDKAEQAFDLLPEDKTKDYENILDTPTKDWLVAGRFNLDINEHIKDEDKTPLLRASFVAEMMRDGSVLVDNFDKDQKDKITSSSAYKYANLQQMRSYKDVSLKEKHQTRLKVLKDYENMSTEHKLAVIIDAVKISTKDFRNDKSNRFFGDNTCSNMEDLMQPLLCERHRRK